VAVTGIDKGRGNIRFDPYSQGKDHRRHMCQEGNEQKKEKI